MEWFKAVTDFIGSLIWPITVLTLVLLFRPELRGLLRAVREIKYPGGSVTVEVEKLEERVQIRSSLGSTIATFPQASFQVTQTDPQLAIAQTRVEVERELFRFSQLAYEGDKASLWSIADQINQHQLKARIESDLAERLRTFVKLSNEIIHGAEVADETKSRLASIGSSLLAKLHYKRKLFELEHEFAGHGLWHLHKGVAPEKLKYYYWSAVAATLPEFVLQL